MSENRWLRDYLIIPLLVGIIVAFFTFIVPRFFEKGKELSYSIDGPLVYSTKIDGVDITSLSFYKVRIWNSGSHFLKNIYVRFVFNSKKKEFKILSINHEPKPKLEFKKINEVESGNKYKRIYYELLNPGDEDVITFVTNSSSSLSLYSKSEDMRFKPVKLTESNKLLDWLGVVGVIVALISTSLSNIMGRRSKTGKSD